MIIHVIYHMRRLVVNALEIKHLHKTIGKKEIIRDLSLTVKEGEIFGFLGPNGSGKTTTIRMITGLMHPTKGSISIFGHDISKNREQALTSLGAVVENPELYGYLSGWENLKQIARIRKIGDVRLKEVVELIGLPKDRIKDKFSKYSLGMKQRLGIGAAILGKPKLLVLDEPMNGLDPTGIVEFRALIKKLSKEEGMAVFVSSHLLEEAEKLCDTVAFLDQGQLITIENVEGMLQKKERIVLRTTMPDEAALLFSQEAIIESFLQEGSELIINMPKDEVNYLVGLLVAEGIYINEIFIRSTVLEERYLEIMKSGDDA